MKPPPTPSGKTVSVLSHRFTGFCLLTKAVPDLSERGICHDGKTVRDPFEDSTRHHPTTNNHPALPIQRSRVKPILVRLRSGAADSRSYSATRGLERYTSGYMALTAQEMVSERCGSLDSFKQMVTRPLNGYNQQLVQTSKRCKIK